MSSSANGSSTGAGADSSSLSGTVRDCEPRPPSEDTSNLWIKTCDGYGAGTTDLVKISFCTGGIMCRAGPPNEYNLGAEFNTSGVWIPVLVPLDYEPTTMDISKVGTDGWCIDALIWRNGRNLLGPCGRVYLDGDLGFHGCSYGVKNSSDIPGYTPFPCGASRRFYHLKNSDNHEYTMSVKPCVGTKLSPAKALFCSEPTCTSSNGNLSYELSVESSPWATTTFSLDFNPSLIKITAQGESWCTEEITFNGYTMLTESNRPLELHEPGAMRYFFNFQREGIPEVSSTFNLQDPQDGIQAKQVHYSVVVTVVVTFVLVSFVFAASFTNCGNRLLRMITMFGRAPEGASDEDGMETRALAGKNPPREFAFPETGPSSRGTAGSQRSTRRSPWLLRGRSDSMDPPPTETDLPGQFSRPRPNAGANHGGDRSGFFPGPLTEYPYPRRKVTVSWRSESSGEGVELPSWPSSLVEELPI